jgi:putative acetyltransferase
MKARLLKIPLAVAAVLMVLLDLVVIIRLYLNGYPTYLDSSFRVHKIPFTTTDWLILLAIISFQAGLFFLVRRSWKRSGWKQPRREKPDSDNAVYQAVDWVWYSAAQMTVTVREMRREDGRSFIEVRNAAVRGIAVKDYPLEVIENWAGPPVTQAMLERSFLNPDKGIRLVAEMDGVIVGMGELIIATNELRACYVSPSAIRKGVGSAIIREIERIALENGISFLQMDSSVTAQPFYKALGYEVLEYGKHILQSGHPMACVRMRKFLR